MTTGRAIAVVGAGFSGVTIAVHLLRAAPSVVTQVYLVERGDRGVGGVAYGTTSASHTLNVPAGRMSAFEDAPDDFLRFVRVREPSLTGGSFVPRRLYGEYLAHTLDDARRASGLPLLRVAGEVVAIEEQPGGLTLALADGCAFDAQAAVLAIGNYPPMAPPSVDDSLLRSLHYARDPWARDALEVDRRDDVLLLGTGLTMCDVALSLRDADQLGTVHAISRRGLLPQSHRLSARPPPHLDPPSSLAEWPDTALGMLRGLRGEVRAREAEGIDWREVVTSIRHDTPALWQRLDLGERDRFLRHARPYWETHRHRSSPETAHGIAELIETGRLEVIAGLPDRLFVDGATVRATFRRRGTTETESICVGKVINCTGPNTDLEHVGDPLVAALRRDGLIRPDGLGLGLDTDADGRLVRADGTVSPRLHLAGPLRKGRFWEHTAVPELRGEARRLAEALAACVASPGRTLPA